MDNPIPNQNKKNEVPSSKLLQESFNRNFQQLDQNKNGFISKKEITSNLYSNSITGNDAKIAEAALENFHSLELQSNDEWGTENDGITKADVNSFEQNRRRNTNNPLASAIDKSLLSDEHNREKFISMLNIYKAKIDDDKSGTLSRAELSHYITTSKDGRTPVGAAKFLLDHFDWLNEIGSANSTGAYSNTLPGDSNRLAIGENELASLATILGPEEPFIERLTAIHQREIDKGMELGKQGRVIAGKGDSGIAAGIGLLLELGGSWKAHEKGYSAVLKDFQSRKAVIESWNFFKK